MISSKATSKIAQVLLSKSKLQPKQTPKPARGHKAAANNGSQKVSKQSDPLGTVTVTCSSLNVRNGAGTNYDRIGGLSMGKSVEYYEAKNGWLRIKYGAQEGWICAQYTTYKAPETPVTDPTPTPNPTPTPDPTPDPPAETFESYQVRITSSNGVNVRDIPGYGENAASGSSILGAIGYGTVVTVLAEQNGWFKINYNGQEAWICGAWSEKVTGGGNVNDPQTPQTPNIGQGQQAAVDLAYSFLNQTTKNLLGTLPYLQDLSSISGTNNGYDLNCANFVSAILQNCGLLGGHSNTVSGVVDLCYAFGYHSTSKSACKPGDVWCSSGHTELVYSNSGGKVTLIGSNNGGDDVQEVTLDSWSPNNVSANYYSLQ